MKCLHPNIVTGISTRYMYGNTRATVFLCVCVGRVIVRSCVCLCENLCLSVAAVKHSSGFVRCAAMIHIRRTDDRKGDLTRSAD